MPATQADRIRNKIVASQEYVETKCIYLKRYYWFNSSVRVSGVDKYKLEKKLKNARISRKIVTQWQNNVDNKPITRRDGHNYNDTS